jgi:transketolase
MDYPHPIYIRLAQGKQDRVLYEPGTIDFKIGMGLVAREGKDAVIFSHGEMVFEAIEAANELEEEGISVSIVDMYSIKPIDKDLIYKTVKAIDNVLVLEDHLMDGGLASAMSDVFVDAGVYPKKFKRLGIPQIYAGFGSGPEQRAKYGYDKNAAKAAVKALVKG